MIVSNLICILFYCVLSGYASVEEHNLREYLFGRQVYNPNLRPVKNSKTVINVENYIKINKLFYLDEVNHRITLNAILVQRWKDELLSWNPSNFSGIEYIYLNYGKIWSPKLIIVSKFTSASNEALKDPYYYHDYQLKLLHDGHVEFVPTVHLTTDCLLNYANYPLDIQMCSFMFQMPFNRDQVNFTVDTTLALNKKSTNSLWDVIDIQYFDKLDPYNSPIENLVVILKRKTKSYINFLPSYLIYIMTLIMFLLPTNSSQRILIGSVCLVMTTVLAYSLSNSLPHDDIAAWPLLGKLYLFNVVLLTFSLLFSSFIINVSKENHLKSVPDWVKKVTINFFSRIFCLQSIAFNVFNSFTRQTYDEDMDVDEQESIELVSREQVQAEDSKLNKVLKSINQHLNQIQYNQQKKSHENKINKEWCFVASIVDRVLFTLYCFIIIITTLNIWKTK